MEEIIKMTCGEWNRPLQLTVGFIAICVVFCKVIREVFAKLVSRLCASVSRAFDWVCERHVEVIMASGVALVLLQAYVESDGDKYVVLGTALFIVILALMHTFHKFGIIVFAVISLPVVALIFVVLPCMLLFTVGHGIYDAVYDMDYFAIPRERVEATQNIEELATHIKGSDFRFEWDGVHTSVEFANMVRVYALGKMDSHRYSFHRNLLLHELRNVEVWVPYNGVYVPRTFDYWLKNHVPDYISRKLVR